MPLDTSSWPQPGARVKYKLTDNSEGESEVVFIGNILGGPFVHLSNGILVFPTLGDDYEEIPVGDKK